MSHTVCLAVSTGCPSSIGPEVSLVAAHEALAEDPALAITLHGDEGALADMARAVRRPLSAPRLSLRVASSLDASERVYGSPSLAGGRAQLAAVDGALDAVLRGDADAIVTAPVSKAAITRAGVPFKGHTEHLAARAGVARVVMSFLGPRLRVALVTTHLAIRRVPDALLADDVTFVIARCVELLRRDLAIAHPRVVVAGLNPHAGEGGMFGDEETRVIEPAVRAAQLHHPDAAIDGPMAAEAAFRHARDGRYDMVVAMYHDQATIASKLLDFGDAVNVTLGLPFIRTSVDHGTAYDIAGRGIADARGMLAALRLAAAMARARRQVVAPPHDEPAPAVHPKQ